MIFGMSLATFILVQVLISLVGIGSGLITMFGLIAGKRLERWTSLFLASTVAASVTGFLFPFHRLLPSHVIGGISLVALAIAMVARYAMRLAGKWRRIYVVCASIALYFNLFIAMVQAFQKAPVLRTLAPTQSEPPFLVAQLAVLALFVVLGTVAAIKFRAVPVRTA
jgi:hypothetical protein